MGGRGSSSGRRSAVSRAASPRAASPPGGGGHRPTLRRVGNADFYSDEYGTNTVKRITQGVREGMWRAEMAPTPKNNIPDGVPIPHSQVSYHTTRQDAEISIRAYHDAVNEYVKSRR